MAGSSFQNAGRDVGQHVFLPCTQTMLFGYKERDDSSYAWNM